MWVVSPQQINALSRKLVCVCVMVEDECLRESGRVKQLPIMVDCTKTCHHRGQALSVKLSLSSIFFRNNPG